MHSMTEQCYTIVTAVKYYLYSVFSVWFVLYEANRKTLQPTLLLMRVVQNFCT